jgi:hypothetical protein
MSNKDTDKCRRCDYWVYVKDDLFKIDNEYIGACRRYPSVVGDSSNMGIGVEVYQKETYWCGEFKLNNDLRKKELNKDFNLPMRGN